VKQRTITFIWALGQWGANSETDQIMVGFFIGDNVSQFKHLETSMIPDS
jgi:hypothetical protein